MRQAKDRALLAAAAAVMIASATAAASQDNERSYLPLQSSKSQDITKGEQAAAQHIRHPSPRARARTRRRHIAEGFYPGPPDLFFLPGMFFFPFF